MPELRKDPVTGRWVIISTDRAKRPNDFVREKVEIRGSGFCPFCFNNESKTPPEIMAYRSDGSAPNTPGWSLRVVPNKFPALRIESSLNRQGEGLYDKMEGFGAHEVVIESPDHSKTLAQLSPRQIEDVLWAFRDRILDLKKDQRFRYILIFKNHGDAAGASLEHSHSQLIGLPIIPKRVLEELTGAKDYFEYKDRCIYCDVIRQEAQSGVRVIAENPAFVAIAPFASRFPFEMWVLPKSHQAAYEESLKFEYEQLALMLKDMLMRLDLVLEKPAYNYVVHSSPLPTTAQEYYHWHIEIMPKL
ncbi:MAG: galactose-1-phosphate uridylyltransferase, partial [Terriglobia bacterium]